MWIIIQDLFARAAESEFFYGGLALGALGSLLGALHVIWRALQVIAGRRWTAVVTVDSRSEVYRHLCLWIEASGVLAHVRHVRTTAGEDTLFAPEGGPFWFRRGGRLCRYDRWMDNKTRIGRVGRPMEVITLTLPFGRPGIVQGWIDEGARLAAERAWKGPTLHVLRGDWWSDVGQVSNRPLSSILSDDDRVERLGQDMRWFFAAEEWYAQRGVPWRRGYLLHGPPGTGKSSVIRALASDLGAGIASVSLTGSQITDDDLREGLACAPERSLIVLEDIDAMFTQRTAGEDGAKLSFSGLLNAIDGVAAQEGRVLVMTTNHRDRLDPALIRPGRADVHVELGPVGADTAARLFLRFFPGEDGLAKDFRDRLGPRLLTPAALQGWLLSQASDARAAATAQGLIEAPILAAE